MSRTIGLALLLGAATAAQATVEAPLDFDRVFVARAGAPRVHYEADYRLGDRPHHVEVWRDREARVRRVTDAALDTLAVRPPGQDEWSMTVLDRHRRIRTDIDRTNLYRIGHVAEWFSQAHALARPRGPYRLTALAGPPPAVEPVATCRWYRLEADGRTSRICWSANVGVPLAIVDANDTVAWRVTRVDAKPVPDTAFAIDDRGYVRNDANADIAAD